MEGKLTCSLSIQLTGKAENELMRTFAKKAGFTVKDNIPKLLIPQKKHVDKYFCEMEDIGLYWIKVDIVKKRETDVPKFRVGRKKKETRWQNRWHIEIGDPSI